MARVGSRALIKLVARLSHRPVTSFAVGNRHSEGAMRWFRAVWYVSVRAEAHETKGRVISSFAIHDSSVLLVRSSCEPSTACYEWISRENKFVLRRTIISSVAATTPICDATGAASNTSFPFRAICKTNCHDPCRHHSAHSELPGICMLLNTVVSTE